MDTSTLQDAPRGTDTIPDRRRPGRQNNVSPALISLLRATAGDGIPNPDADEEIDQLAAARGIISGVLISAAFWLLMAGVARAVWVLI